MGLKQLPKLPKNKMAWIKEARPFVGRIERTFDWEPFWLDVYDDTSSEIVIVNSRQTFKSTFGTDVIGCYATSHDNTEVTYIVDRADRASAWSKQRFRKDTMLENPILRQFLPQGRAAVGEINFTNNSVIYVRTDENEYNNVQGMTNGVMVFDECQYQELQFRAAALYTMTHTKGQSYYLGIGGEAGSEWHKMWKNSDQKEWVFDDKNWREKLKFDEFGDLSNEHPENIVSGKWVAAAPRNYNSGYHMAQSIFARIPLTINDALHLYKTRPDTSIEFQKKYNSSSMVASHVYGEFFKAMRRPVTPDMVEFCKNKDLSLLTGKQVRELKAANRSDVFIFLGVDWGSGPSASQTVGSIIIYWKKFNRYQLAWIDPRPMENEHDQFAYFVNLFNEYGCDFCVADMGYGADKVTSMQKGGYTSTGEQVYGLGRGKVMGAWSSGTLLEENMRYKGEHLTDKTKVGEKLPHIPVSKTKIIQDFIDMLGTTISDSEGEAQSQFIIPASDESRIDFLMNDFCDITRKDLVEDQETTIEDGRQNPKKEFNHPKDSVVSIIMCMIAKSYFDPKGFEISKIRTKIKSRRR